MAKADFKCPNCKKVEEFLLTGEKFSCSTCGQEMKRLWSAVAVIIK